MRRKEAHSLSIAADDTVEKAYWSQPVTDLFNALSTSATGLSLNEAAKRLAKNGPNTVGNASHPSAIGTFVHQFRSSLVLILVFAAGVSAAVGDVSDATIISVIVLASCFLSFTQEYRASQAMDALRLRVSRKVTVIRGGIEAIISSEEIVPGDIVKLSAGNMIPADGIILSACDFNVSEATLTGETFPVVKAPGQSLVDATITQRNNVVYTGTSVRSGTATIVAVETGDRTEFASIAAAIERRSPETDFARGIRRFGYLMTEIMLAIVIVVFFANLLLHRPLIDSLLFSLALAVGLTPELLPAIISVTLSHGARIMAQNGVIVRRLEAIENLGSMDLLCTDKTGTLTEGVVHLDGWYDADGELSTELLLWARLNASLQTGLKNPLDEAIASSTDIKTDISTYAKVDEIPYDFIRKRLSVVVRQENVAAEEYLLICKGAVQNVVEVCSTIRVGSGSAPLDDEHRKIIDARYQAWSAKGFRVLAVAIRQMSQQPRYLKDEEKELVFAGFLLFLDPPKSGISETLIALGRCGVAVKMITGDNRYVAAHLAAQIGLDASRIMTGQQLNTLTKNALFGKVPDISLFVEIDPNQKERIIAALRARGHVVGYLGDGINDAPALHEADIGISVDSAVDVARDAADIILLKRDLGVLLRGIEDGRRSFSNTMKYISITTSANFGNMISMAAASLFLPFLPLLAKQILLNNLLSSLPSLAIAGDNVDAEQTLTPRRWDIGAVRRFMISFGLISSLFDFLTFGFLLLVLHASVDIFRTAWFIESLLTQLAIILIVRTYHAFWLSRPSHLLFGLTLCVALFAIAIPYLPISGWLGFTPLPLPILLGVVAITGLYLFVSEATKRWFFEQERRKHLKS